MKRARNSADSDCVAGCNEVCLTMAQQVLRRNKINWIVFAATLRDLLEKRRACYGNIMVIRPTNSGKTFLFSPLEKVFQVFSNPAEEGHAWMETERNEIIFLNDFRCSKEILGRREFLLLLEWQPVLSIAPGHMPECRYHSFCHIVKNKVWKEWKDWW